MRTIHPLHCTLVLSTVLVAFPSHAVDIDAVQKEVDGMNQSLPAMVSPVLREERIRFAANTLAYTFTYVGRSAADAAKETPKARSYLLGKLCGDADTRQMMRDGLQFIFNYVDEKNTPVQGVALTEADCAAKR